MTNGPQLGTYGSRAYIIVMYPHVGGRVWVDIDSSQRERVRSICGVARGGGEVAVGEGMKRAV
jgi:hypothetical protein